MTLGLVIPTKNDERFLFRLLRGALDLKIFDQVIVVDDGSDIALKLPSELAKDVIVIRHYPSLGPGIARNRGLERVTTSHVLFFDSDDLLTEELSFLWKELNGLKFDFCIFRHADSRSFPSGNWRQMKIDDLIWRKAGFGGVSLRPLNREQAALLATTANYPWNKIYRTNFLKQHGIQFPRTSLHEDVLPHWRCFLCGDKILASDRIAAVHYVADGAARQTNRSDAQRLQVFDAFFEIWREIELHSLRLSEFRYPFLLFALNLIEWLRGILDYSHHENLRELSQAFLERTVDDEVKKLLFSEDPDFRPKQLDWFFDEECELPPKKGSFR